GANLVDHENIWETFPLYARFVYTVGDAQCHQLWYRSFLLNGNQMPIDQRMTSMYLFANLGLLAAIFARPSTSTGQVMLNALPEFLRRRLWKFGPDRAGALVLALGLIPMAIDGFTQLSGRYESTAIARVLTGGGAGLGRRDRVGARRGGRLLPPVFGPPGPRLLRGHPGRLRAILLPADDRHQHRRLQEARLDRPWHHVFLQLARLLDSPPESALRRLHESDDPIGLRFAIPLRVHGTPVVPAPRGRRRDDQAEPAQHLGLRAVPRLRQRRPGERPGGSDAERPSRVRAECDAADRVQPMREPHHGDVSRRHVQRLVRLQRILVRGDRSEEHTSELQSLAYL